MTLKGARTLVLAAVLVSSQAFAFQCKLAGQGYRKTILKAQWNSNGTAIVDMKVLDRERANVLFQHSNSSPDGFNGVYSFQDDLPLAGGTDRDKPPTFWERVFRDRPEPDSFIGDVSTSLFYLTDDTEFRFLSVSLLVPASAPEDSEFRAELDVTSHARIDPPDESLRNPIEDQLICVQ